VAVTALATQDKITYDGNVFIPGQRRFTSGTVGGREDYGAILAGESKNDDIEKTANNGPKE
jgi:hypothetical protein